MSMCMLCSSVITWGQRTVLVCVYCCVLGVPHVCGQELGAVAWLFPYRQQLEEATVFSMEQSAVD